MSESYPSTYLENEQTPPASRLMDRSNWRVRVGGAVLSAFAVTSVTSCGNGGDRYKDDSELVAGYVIDMDHDLAKMATISVDRPIGCVDKNGKISTKTAVPSQKSNAPKGGKSTPKGGKAGKSVGFPLAVGVRCHTEKIAYLKKPEKYEITLQACFGAPDKDCRENEIIVDKEIYEHAQINQYFDLNQMPPYTKAPDVFKPE